MNANVVDTKQRLDISNASSGGIFFDRSNDVVSIFHPKSRLPDLDGFKSMGVYALEQVKSCRNNGVVVGIIESDKCPEQDFDVKSDVATSASNPMDLDNGSSDEEEFGCDDDILLLYEDGVRKKLELLAKMVGVDSSNPHIVLAHVVSILRSLETGRDAALSLCCQNQKI